MTEIHVGDRNVTNEYVRFQRLARGTQLDGNFTGAEKKKYIQAINYLQRKGAISERKATLFRNLINSKCSNKALANDVHLALYEELTQFIESGAFKSLKNKNIKASLVALQIDVFQRLRFQGYAMNKSQYLGTSSETPYTGFKADKQTWEKAQKTPLDLRSCKERYDNVEEETDSSSRYAQDEGSEPAPFGKIIQTDMRYRDDYKLKKHSAKVAEADKESYTGKMGSIFDENGEVNDDDEWN